jgi:hypothetical protein
MNQQQHYWTSLLPVGKHLYSALCSCRHLDYASATKSPATRTMTIRQAMAMLVICATRRFKTGHRWI